ncbi:2-oxo acid dehydrogenase subunit E2 [Mesorhizobium onobrychidis]|uniref:2-oxo acid dehydrogenase subunit E2 n=1 Tax=Mesorhizobium onobrychidis TaxID=2775404 RepID=A0ABY5QXK6_9HYPH|nr:2-oxo acid dehydrogenase subunit E2 [Mesorhizobium onobrychidis]UVC15399.1 2-oxo acid dehydrogenase subunit E2 [Mesorhizobium onobrychidis]
MCRSFTEIPLTPLRKAIAARMTQAKQTIPHFRLVANLEIDALLRWRAAINDTDPTKKTSVNDCLIKAVAASLVDNPALNCQITDTAIHRFHSADISVVIALEGGLATPVIRGAEAKSVVEISAEVKNFAERAGRNALNLSEISGGSFSISNLGGYGVEQFDAIINAPQCAILAVGKAEPRVVADRIGKTKVATMLTCTLSVDHRAVDGVEASKFLHGLRDVILDPDRLERA